MRSEADSLQGTGRYKWRGLLGNGTYGSVHLARNIDSGKSSAIKFLRREDPEILKYVEGEILNHRVLQRHPYVIRFKEVFLTSDYICIAMEYARGGTLSDYVDKQELKRLKEEDARWFFQQLIIGVDYCHKRGVAIRDIKLENALLQPNMKAPEELPTLKICDLGLSKADHQSAAKSTVGTIVYMAPEVLRTDGTDKYDGMVADIWSCGVMLYVMLYGRYPFVTPEVIKKPQTAQINTILGNIKGKHYQLPTGVEVTDNCKDLWEKMLEPDPRKRITLGATMKHPWFTTSLPEGANIMNEHFLKADLPEGHQQESDEIKRIIEEARSSLRGAPAYGKATR